MREELNGMCIDSDRILAHYNGATKSPLYWQAFICAPADVLHRTSRENIFSITGDLSARHKLSHFVLSRETQQCIIHRRAQSSKERVFSSKSEKTGTEKNCIWSPLSSSTDKKGNCSGPPGDAQQRCCASLAKLHCSKTTGRSYLVELSRCLMIGSIWKQEPRTGAKGWLDSRTLSSVWSGLNLKHLKSRSRRESRNIYHITSTIFQLLEPTPKVKPEGRWSKLNEGN